MSPRAAFAPVVAPTRPMLRYHGGKWRLAPWILTHCPPHKTYTEAFAGAASVLYQKPRAYAEVINDLDNDIINVFSILRNPASADQLEQLVRLTPYSRAEFEQAYAPADDPLERARRTIIRSFMGFGSGATTLESTGFRSNTTRPGSIPAHDWTTWPQHVQRFTQRLAGVIIENRPAVEVLKRYDHTAALHYVDPPYLEGLRFTGDNYRHEMSDDDHRELAATLHGLDGMIVLSGYASGLYDELYGTWKQVERHAYADGARERTEVLWLNPAAHQALNESRSSVTQPSLMGSL